MKPFMKWAGGKRQLLEELVKRLPKSYDCYYEPFLGCGALLLHLKPEKAVAGDVNRQLINLWLQIKDNLPLLLQEVRWFNQTPCTKDRYVKMRYEYNLLKNRDSVATGSAALWLNAHCFNGLYRVNSKGDFNVPWNRKTTGCSLDIENLTVMSSYLKRVDIKARDYKETCAAAEEGDFVYFDPPYDPLSDTAGFTAYTEGDFGVKDQEELAAFVYDLTKRNVFVMLSNNDTPLIRQLYFPYKIETVEVKRNINRDGNNRTSSEVIITNY